MIHPEDLIVRRRLVGLEPERQQHHLPMSLGGDLLDALADAFYSGSIRLAELKTSQ
jgi:hypothetical protein